MHKNIKDRSLHHNNSKETRINDDIDADKVQLIDQNGTNQGIVDFNVALSQAKQYNFDLVEIVPNVSPPVCKIVNYGKYKYNLQKKLNEKKRRQKNSTLKEIKLKLNIEPHDLQIKMKNVTRFLNSNDMVKITMRFRGREIKLAYRGQNIMTDIIQNTQDISRVVRTPSMEGNQLIMVLAPK